MKYVVLIVAAILIFGLNFTFASLGIAEEKSEFLLIFSGFIGMIAFFLFLTLASNKKFSLADSATQAEARKMKPEAGKGKIYILRKGSLASQQIMDIAIDGLHEAHVKSGIFLMAEVERGKYRINCTFPHGKTTQMEVNVTAGSVHLLIVTAAMGLLAPTAKITKYEGDDPQRHLRKAKLALWK